MGDDCVLSAEAVVLLRSLAKQPNHSAGIREGGAPDLIRELLTEGAIRVGTECVGPLGIVTGARCATLTKHGLAIVRREEMLVERVVWLRCRAANNLQLAACYQEEADNLIQEANRLNGEEEDAWFADICNQNTDTLPDNWLEIAEMPDPAEAP